MQFCLSFFYFLFQNFISKCFYFKILFFLQLITIISNSISNSIFKFYFQIKKIEKLLNKKNCKNVKSIF